MKNKLNHLIILLLFIPTVLLSQSNVKNKTFQEIKADRDAYFAKQLQERGKKYMQEEGSEYHQYKNWLRLWEPRIGGNNGTIEDYITNLSQAVDAVSKLKSTSQSRAAGFSDPWTELGPRDRPATGLDEIGYGDRGIGPIHYITFFKPNPAIMLASSPAGGLFYSSNGGVDWQNAGSDKWTMSGCISAAFSPASSLTWYGCSNLGGNNNRHAREKEFAIGPGGVWRTTDAGLTYTLIGDKNDFSLGEETTIHKILIDPNNASVGYLATTAGLYKSGNITAPNPIWTQIQSGNISDVEFKSNSNGSIIFITLQATYAPDNNGNYISRDWGMKFSTNWGGLATSGTWNSITPPGGFKANEAVPAGKFEPGNLEMTMTDADPNLIYLLDVGTTGQAMAKLYTYSYNTNTWVLRNDNVQAAFGFGRALGVSNVNANVVYIGSSIKPPNEIPGYLFKSTNFGANFPPQPIDPLSTTTPYHVDVECIAIPPYTSTNGTDVYIATHGGVSYSSNACANITSRSRGLGVAEVSGMSQSDHNHNKIVMGLNHDGSVLSDIAGTSLSWETVYGGDGMRPFIDNYNSDYVHVNAYGGYNYVFSSTGGHAGTYGSGALSTPNLYIEQNIVSQNYLYYSKVVSGTAQVFRSNNNGISNSEAITNINMSIFSTACAPTNPNYLYINGDKNGERTLLRNTNVNAAAATVKTTWKELTLPDISSSGQVVVDNTNPNIVYLSYYGGYIWKADYSNVNIPVFTEMWGDFPLWKSKNPLQSIVVERGSNGGLYASTELGIYYTNNELQAESPPHWEKIANLPNISKSGMEINYTSNKIRVSTSGRVVWEHNLICPNEDVIPFNGIGIAPRFFEANNITAENSMTSPFGVTTFRATKSVTLNPGFISEVSGSGAYFLAFIHGCSSPGNSFFVNNNEQSELIMGKDEDHDQNRIEENSIRLYPNPNSGLFNISFSNNDEKNVCVYDMIGKIIFQKEKLRENTLEVDISNQPKGIYLVKVTNGDNVISKRIIVH